MEPITITGSLFVFVLYKTTEKIWEKALDVTWDPIDQPLKERFARWIGADQATQRQEAFAQAAETARANTLRLAADREQARQILYALNNPKDRRSVEALAEEAAKLMLFSAAPDVPRLTQICQRTLRLQTFFPEGAQPSPEIVAAVISDFLTNLREALLDQEPYHDLIKKNMRQTLREILTELRPVPYDDEATYRFQMAEMHRQLDFVGIPELKERRPITVEDIFIHLRTEREVEFPPERELLKAHRRAQELGDEETLDRLRDAEERMPHAQALSQLGRVDDAARILLALARDERVDALVRRKAAEALSQLGRVDDAAPILLAVARDERVDARERHEAARALSQLGRVDDAARILLAVARDERADVWVRREAAEALAQLGRADDAVLDGLLAVARDERVDAEVRCEIAQALGQLGRADDAAPILLTLACDERVDAWMRHEAARALGKLGRADDAAPILLALAHDERVDLWTHQRGDGPGIFPSTGTTLHHGFQTQSDTT
jgi:thioredoxin-like negative regulator of GroEL